MENDAAMLDLFVEVTPDEYLEAVSRANGWDGGRQIYNTRVVIWLMLYQRWEVASQKAAVARLAEGRLNHLLTASKRVREGRISAATGAYAIAREDMPVAVLRELTDHSIDQVRAAAGSGDCRPVFLLDGSTLTLEHVPELLKAFPPGKNQHGEGHWPILEVLVAHDLDSGVALRPVWGPMYGPQAVSEQQLTEELLNRVPANAVVMGDINFGVFSVAYAARQGGHDALLRLSRARAKRLVRKLRPGTDEPICWRPSDWDRRKHPQLPADAEVSGRLIVVTVAGLREPLYLFTTLEDPVSAIGRMYLKRWNIETDLRSLKRTADLHHLTAKSLEMVEKELLAATIAYALVRGLMMVAARRAGLAPRQLSFAHVQVMLDAFIRGLCCPESPEFRQRQWERLLAYVAACKLPKRRKARQYPREVWGFRQNFPRRRPPKIK
jgi:hypothetical protein